MAAGRRHFRDSFETILIAIFVALLVRTYFVTGYKVPGTSMAPTLLPGDFVFAFRPSGGFKIPLSSTKIGVRMPERGELLVFTFPDQPRTNYIKRVIGLAGDKVQMQKGKLILNDQPLEYLPQTTPEGVSAEEFEAFTEKGSDSSRLILRQKNLPGKDFGPLVVPPGEIFVLGDHRDLSDDSRYWGTVPVERIEGRVFMIWLSLDWGTDSSGRRFPSLRGNRLFQSLH